MPPISVPRRRRVHNPEARMSVIDHLRELRKRIVLVLLIVAAGAVLAYVFYDPILSTLKAPYCNVPDKYRPVSQDGTCRLAYFGPADGFIARLKICAIGGTVLTAPLWLYQLWAFVTPGLRRNERKYTVIFVFASSALFITGMALAYTVLFTGLKVLIEAGGNGTQPVLGVNQYISFVVLLMLVFGASFELPLLIVILNLVRVLPYRLLRRWQRLGIFLIFVFAGVATPTADPFTMCAMAIPMVILFEAAVMFAFVHDRRRARRQAEDEAAGLADDEASRVDPIPERVDGETSWSALP
ncbi:MAG: twin-arginine translocase subunit TatC [bacterium]